MGTSPLPSRRPKRGRKCYITPAFLGIPNIGDKNKKWLPHPCLLGGPKEGRNATSPLHSPGSPTPSVASKIRSGPQHRGTKSEVAASPLPSRGPKGGTFATSPVHSRGSPTPSWGAKSKVVPDIGEQNQKWLPHPCLFGGPKEGLNAMSPVHSQGSPTPSVGRKFKSGPLQRGTKSKVATSPVHSRRPKRGQTCYITCAFSGIPNLGYKNQKWLPHPCLPGGPKEGGNATSPLHARGSPT